MKHSSARRLVKKVSIHDLEATHGGIATEGRPLSDNVVDLQTPDGSPSSVYFGQADPYVTGFSSGYSGQAGEYVPEREQVPFDPPDYRFPSGGDRSPSAGDRWEDMGVSPGENDPRYGDGGRVSDGFFDYQPEAGGGESSGNSTAPSASSPDRELFQEPTTSREDPGDWQ